MKKGKKKKVMPRLMEKQFIVAVKSNDVDTVARLIAAGADVNTADDYYDTALIWAARAGHIDIVHILIAAGADVKITNIDGNTALIVASRRCYKEITSVLTKAAEASIKL